LCKTGSSGPRFQQRLDESSGCSIACIRARKIAAALPFAHPRFVAALLFELASATGFRK
jgi:hypothetical protein